jgi:glycosyltransferase involved in cell wall biosynthesis
MERTVTTERCDPRVAIVHDYLMQMGGAEKVVEVLHDMFPEAPVYTSAYDPRAMPDRFRTWDIRTSFLQRMPAKQHMQRLALLLYPMAFETLDLAGYNLVLSSSSTFAKGILTGPDCTHICYCHTPMRYAWLGGTVRDERASGITRALIGPALHYLRLWDAVATNRVDRFVANSSVVARRIGKFYRRTCDIVHPPVDTDRFSISDEVENYCIIVSRCIPYKRLDIAVDAFTRMNRPLKVVGTGRGMKALQSRAGRTVEFLGHVPDRDLPTLMSRAKAYIMPGEEDFGIAPVEANACGRPVIAYAAGGALDSQVDGITARLFPEQTVDALCDAMERMEHMEIDPVAIRAHAEGFGIHAFRAAMSRVIADELERSHGNLTLPKLADAPYQGALV